MASSTILPGTSEYNAAVDALESKVFPFRACGDREGEARAYCDLIEFAQNNAWRPDEYLRMMYSGKAGVIYAELGQHAKAIPFLQEGLKHPSKRNPWESPIRYYLMKSLEATGDAEGAVAVVEGKHGGITIASNHIARIETTVDELAATGVSRADILKFFTGIWYYGSGEDGHRGFARGQTMMRQVADKYPTNPWINMAAVFGVVCKNDEYHYAERAYTYGNATMRKMLMVDGGTGSYGASLAAKKMGHPYIHRYFSTGHLHADGTYTVTEDP